MGGYTTQDFMDFFNSETLFACHKTLKSDCTVQEMEQNVLDCKIPLCRGYVDSIIKSCKLPKRGILLDVYKTVKNEGCADETMSIYAFHNHHNYNKDRE